MKQAYISTHLADAQSAGDRFHLNPIILLAQAALCLLYTSDAADE
mgnify:CR=1 FL=1